MFGFDEVFSLFNGKVNKVFGNGILSMASRYAGKYIQDVIEREFAEEKLISKTHNLKEGFTFSHAKYGDPIPLVFGKVKIPGQIIWIDKVIQKSHTDVETKYFKKQYISREDIYFDYYVSFAVSLCEGPIDEITKVWANDELIDIYSYRHRVYPGSEDQMPDPLILKKNYYRAPAFRGIAYIVFEEMPLVDFNNKIPNLSFEILRKPNNTTNDQMLEYAIKAFCIIPGSGEYVYDTIIGRKKPLYEGGVERYINKHTHYGSADSLVSLSQLQTICPNLEWAAPVVCWFGNSLDIKDCLIRPAIEFNDQRNFEYSDEWKVANFIRLNAYQIGRDSFNNPRYGGTINDQSIVRYLAELKSRNIKIMFYPMFFLDLENKPWRGRLTGNASDVSNFFHNEYGYNKFIIHYANLVKNYVDAFIIGSELIGLTKIKNEDNSFPAVIELANLARDVKNILGKNVLVSYAADWSEYHHTDGGWYNLDTLWSSNNIDFIGIDAYFPITDINNSNITKENIEKGFKSGEGYDYYIDGNGNKQDLGADYAWKNIYHWWSNYHTNPNGAITEWNPKSKKIWFTEFGFPSIDKCTNNPNRFYDPLSLDGAIPNYSNGESDFNLQRISIYTFIKYWENESEYIEKMFLWCWDARPMPAWPFGSFWQDGYLWEKGHWLNGKLGANNLSSILREISKRCAIDNCDINVDTITASVSGLLFDKQISGIEAINILRSSYFFDTTICNKDKITFSKRENKGIA